jgi:Rrf2 family protein
MDMTLSKRGDYVVRSAISLARAFEEGVPRKIREVVGETEVPQTFASQILADLVRAGVASSRAGRNGGYWLARAPEDISVLEVVEAAEGPLHAERCALGEGPCRWESVCPLHETWSEATAMLRQVLAATTLAEVAARDRSIEDGDIPDSGRLAPHGSGCRRRRRRRPRRAGRDRGARPALAFGAPARPRHRHSRQRGHPFRAADRRSQDSARRSSPTVRQCGPS